MVFRGKRTDRVICFEMLVQAIHQMHRDHVPTVPDGFELLGSTPICEIHGMVKISPSANHASSQAKPLELKDIQVLTLQGNSYFYL